MILDRRLPSAVTRRSKIIRTGRRSSHALSVLRLPHIAGQCLVLEAVIVRVDGAHGALAEHLMKQRIMTIVVAGAAPDVIRTPDQRVRVFVSSTLQELAAERQAVRDAVTRLRLVPVMFELGARPHPPRPVYRAYLAQSQVFVGIYWQSYGWVAPGEQVSGLEDEYELSAGLPRLVYVKAPALDCEPRLAALLARIRDEGGVAYKAFADPAGLQQLVEDDLAVLLSERFEMTRPGAGTGSAAAS